MFSIFLCASESIGTVKRAWRPDLFTETPESANQNQENQWIGIRRISESESGESSHVWWRESANNQIIAVLILKCFMWKSMAIWCMRHSQQ